MVLFSAFIFSSLTHAAIEMDKGILFYKSPQSPFASGQTNIQTLVKKKQKDYFESTHLVQNGQRQFWVLAQDMARDLDLCSRAFSEKYQKEVKLIRLSEEMALIETLQNPVQEWVSLADLSPLPDDLGLILTLTSTQLKTLPHWKSDSLMTLPPQSRLKWLRSDDGWALVEFTSIGKVQGWVDLSNVLTKLDFAQFILTHDKKWIPVNHREGGVMVTLSRSGDKIETPLTSVHGVMTAIDLGISLVTDDQKKMLLRQNLKIIRSQAINWSVSLLEGHGEVFWKANAEEKPTPPLAHLPLNDLSLNDHRLSTEQLLKREVTAFSFHPQKPHLGLASSQGIFLTTDGKIWNRLHSFKKQNHAVFIDEFGVFYVGDQRSFDGGKTFSPYLRWESLAQLLEQRLKRPPGKIQIQQIKAPRPGIISMNLVTDNGSLTVAARNSLDLLNRWDLY